MRSIQKSMMIVMMVILMVGIPCKVMADVTKPAVFHDDMTITLNGTVYDARIVMIEGEAYVPIHILGFVVNAITDWDEPNRIVHVNKQKEPVEIRKIPQSLDGSYVNKIAYFSDDIRLVVDGEQLEDQVIIVEARSYLPLKAIAECMGVRVKIDEANKTIKVSNPQITEVEGAYEDFYVTVLPPIEEEADYLIGNWAGQLHGNWSRGECTSQLKAFISKNEDSTYKVVLDWTDIFYDADERLVKQYTRGVDKSKFNFVHDAENKVFTMNNYGTLEYTATYDPNTNILECVPSKLIKSYKKNDTLKKKSAFRFVLKDEVLHFYSKTTERVNDVTGGELERF